MLGCHIYAFCPFLATLGEVCVVGIHKVGNFMDPSGPLKVMHDGYEVWQCFESKHKIVVPFIIILTKNEFNTCIAPVRQ